MLNAQTRVSLNLQTSPCNTCDIIISGEILWAHWIKAFEYNINRPRHLYPNLSREHIYVGEMDKMSNGLAEEVLNKNMVYVMKVKSC